MQYSDLHELIGNSGSARKYFLSLPVEMQLALHTHNDYIHTADELHRRVGAVEAYNRQVALSEYYPHKDMRKLYSL